MVGHLVLFTGHKTTRSRVDYRLVAPESVVLKIETREGLAEPIEFGRPKKNET